MSDSDTIFVFILTVLGGFGFSYVMFAIGCHVGRCESRDDES